MNAHTKIEYDFNQEVEGRDNPHVYDLQVTEKIRIRKSMDLQPINNYGHRCWNFARLLTFEY